MAVGFEFFVQNLQNFGFYNFLLPWILLFATIYGIFQYANVLGDNKGVHIVISLAISLMVLGGLYTFIPTDFFTAFFSRFAIVIVAILALAILLGFFGIKLNELAPSGKDGKFKWIIFAILAIIVLLIVVFLVFNVQMTATGVGGALSSFFSSSGFLNTFWLLLMVGFIVLVVWMVTKEAKG